MSNVVDKIRECHNDMTGGTPLEQGIAQAYLTWLITNYAPQIAALIEAAEGQANHCACNCSFCEAVYDAVSNLNAVEEKHEREQSR